MSSFDRVIEPIHPGLLSLFEGTTVLRIDPEVTGNKVVEQAVIFGASAALNIKNENLLHEVAHFVEIDQRRMATFGWGLRCKTQVRIMGNYYAEPRTSQSTDRECRVIAYQKNLADFLGLEHDHVDFIRSLRFMKDSTFVPLKDGRLPYTDKSDTQNMSSEEIRESQHAWCVDRVEKYRSEMTAGKFLSEWYRRRAILELRMKKKGKIH